jgi:hypothetical protein
MSSIGSSKIAEMYVGSTKIAQAYLGSSLVFQISQPVADYDSYKVHITWDGNGQDSFNMAGLKINGVQATTSQVTSMWIYNTNLIPNWEEVSSSDIASAIDWNSPNGQAFYGNGIDINFTSDNPVSSVQVHTGLYWGGTSWPVTVHVAGVKDGVETDLGYTSNRNSANLIYTVNI